MASDVVIDDYMKNLMLALAVPENKIKEQQVLAKILKQIVAKEDGELLIQMGKDGGTIPELSERLKMDEKALTKKLGGLFMEQGIVHPELSKKGPIWKPTGALLLHDLVFMNPKYQPDTHKELLDLLDEYYETVMAPVLGHIDRTLFRIVPVNEVISVSQTKVLPYEEVAKIINKSRRIGVAHCVCRKRARRCDHPSEVCLSFDMAADMLIQRKFARKISKEEAFKVIKIAEEAGLVHCVDNKQEGLVFICNCCSCGCGAVRGVVAHGYRSLITQSRYQAVLDTDACIGCGTCVEKCQFNAITLEDEKAVINLENCWGCGNCAANCAQAAISLKVIRPPEHIPETGVSFMGF